MALTKENKIIVGIGALGVAILGVMFYRKKQQETAQESEPATETPAVQVPATKPTQGATLNKNLILKVGSKGLEVRELQRLLGFTGKGIDGDFGKLTLGALQKAKGVTQISLNAFVAKATPKPVATLPKTTYIKTPAVGSKLMCVKDETQLYGSRQNADKTYSKIDPIWIGGILNYGDEAGIFKAHKSNGDFLILHNGALKFISGLAVKTIK